MDVGQGDRILPVVLRRTHRRVPGVLILDGDLLERVRRMVGINDVDRAIGQRTPDLLHPGGVFGDETARTGAALEPLQVLAREVVILRIDGAGHPLAAFLGRADEAQAARRVSVNEMQAHSAQPWQVE